MPGTEQVAEQLREESQFTVLSKMDLEKDYYGAWSVILFTALGFRLLDEGSELSTRVMQWIVSRIGLARSDCPVLCRIVLLARTHRDSSTEAILGALPQEMGVLFSRHQMGWFLSPFASLSAPFLSLDLYQLLSWHRSYVTPLWEGGLRRHKGKLFSP